MKNPFYTYKEEFMRADLEFGNMPATGIPFWASKYLCTKKLMGALVILHALILETKSDQDLGSIEIILPLKKFSEEKLGMDTQSVTKYLSILHDLKIIVYTSGAELKSKSFRVVFNTFDLWIPEYKGER